MVCKVLPYLRAHQHELPSATVRLLWTRIGQLLLTAPVESPLAITNLDVIMKNRTTKTPSQDVGDTLAAPLVSWTCFNS
jgi:hypothetical protein